jgi:hypothetical protein
VLAIPTLLLTVGVVYCQMHYGVDALAGLMVGALVALVLGSTGVSWNNESVSGTSQSIRTEKLKAG